MGQIIDLRGFLSVSLLNSGFGLRVFEVRVQMEAITQGTELRTGATNTKRTKQNGLEYIRNRNTGTQERHRGTKQKW